MEFKRDESGSIHDAVMAHGGEGWLRARIVVMGIEDARDDVSFSMHSLGVTASTLLRPEDARRLGALLIAAAEPRDLTDGKGGR